MYTLKDIASNQITFLNESQLVDLEEVNSVTIIIKYDERKVVKAHIGLYNYLFGSILKNIIGTKVKKDLGYDFIFKFAV